MENPIKGLNTTLNSIVAFASGLSVIPSINSPEILKFCPGLTLGHGVIVRTDMTEGCFIILVRFPALSSCIVVRI